MNSAKNKTLGTTKKQKDLVEIIGNVDLQILNLLQQDSRISFNKIASQLGISVGTAFNHVKNLEKKGVLKGYTTVLDPAKLGYGLTALILIQAEGGHLGEVESEISKAANVIAVYDITGDYDAAVITKFKDRAELNVFIKGLMATPYVKRTVTSVALDVIKEELRMRLEEQGKSSASVLPKENIFCLYVTVFVLLN
jgi:DNA-binding Lrp family transcriptional regulator